MKKQGKRDSVTNTTEHKSLECGLVMPISAIDGCTAEHRSDVRNILIETVETIDEPKFSAKLVSEAADVGMILRRIVRNVFQKDIVICDVSGKNPNVMFELGMRLAFDKPVVIIKDDQTDYSFDTSVIEHLIYPRDLRYGLMVEFKELLKSKVVDTYKDAQQSGYQGFLKNFGTFKVAHLEEKTGTLEEVILNKLGEMQKDIALLQKSATPRTASMWIEAEKGLGGSSVWNPSPIGYELAADINRSKLKNTNKLVELLGGSVENPGEGL